MTTKETKIKLIELDKTQVELARELNKRGFPYVTASSVSKVINRNHVWETAGGDLDECQKSRQAKAKY